MVKKNTVDSEFEALCVRIVRAYGMDDLHAKIFSILYLSCEDPSLDEIAEKTGYSLATISKRMKIMETVLCLTKYRKPGSKKMYFSMEKDIGKLFSKMAKLKYEAQVVPIKEELPSIIKKYDDSSNEETIEKIQRLKSLSRHTSFMEKIMKLVIKMKGG